MSLMGDAMATRFRDLGVKAPDTRSWEQRIDETVVGQPITQQLLAHMRNMRAEVVYHCLNAREVAPEHAKALCMIDMYFKHASEVISGTAPA